MIESSEFMKTIRYWLLAGIAGAILVCAGSLQAQTAVTPTTTPTPPATLAPNTGTAGVPSGIQTLITSFDQTRDNYLKTQDSLLLKLKSATTAAERKQLRDQLQANRDAFLATLKGFREQIKDQLAALKGKISHEEALRIIDEAYNAATEGGLSHHRGH
jgi:phage tail tape-measure protein